MQTIRPTLACLILFTVLFGAAYPTASTVVLQILFPVQAQGSFILSKDHKLLGSALIGQPVSGAAYFWGRLSATTPYAYNASASIGSNFGSNNPALMEATKARVAALQAADPGNKQPIPIDLVTASGSGLDPHISVAAAEYQLARVARVRRLSKARVQQLIEQYTEGRQFWVLGERRVNVLKLNLALDKKI